MNKSFSNYVHTPVSLASSLNMEYVNFIADELGEYSIDLNLPYRMIRDSRVMRILKSYGYKFVLIRSGWGPTNRNNHADISIRTGTHNEFIKMIFHTSILVIIEKKLIILDWHRRAVRRMFTELANSREITGPKFVLTHITIPHAPFVFDAEGGAVVPRDVMMGQNIWLPREGYVEQLKYVNRRMREVIESILSVDGAKRKHGQQVARATPTLTTGTKREHGQQVARATPTLTTGAKREHGQQVARATPKLTTGTKREHGQQVARATPTLTTITPIIIIQGDHGPASLDEWKNPGDDFLIERMGILNAYLLPGAASGQLYDTISPVNSFRLVFNALFDTDFDLLPDRYYFSDLSTPYRLKDVTDTIHTHGGVCY